MFEDSEWQAIAVKITDLTKSKKLTWTRASSSSKISPEYIAQVSDSTMYRIKAVDADGQFPYALQLMQSAERDGIFLVVAEFQGEPFTTGDGSASALINDLYSGLERIITGAPELFKSLLSELENLDD